jgi:putative SOS response-associated peptidase YedK
MCYSAQIRAGYEKYVRAYGADISIREFVQLYWDRSQGVKVKTPKAMDMSFTTLEGPDGQKIRELVTAFNAEQATKLEQELFKQKKRLADAERTLLTKTTKAATESKRIATDKVAWSLGKLADLRRNDLIDEDSRIFPGWYAPVMVIENGKRVIKPMRYQCRPAGTPSNYDFKFPGTYNARRDNLEGGYWKRLFGYSHGVMIVNAFFENVSRHAMEHRELAPGETEENVVLEFRPRPQHDMLVACLWSHWKGRPDEPELLSFAAITDEPPAEVAAAGHDRCIVPIKPEHLDAWLNPEPANMAALYAILDDRDRPFYEHRLAA